MLLTESIPVENNGTSISVRVVSDEASFAGLSEPWSRLLESSPDANVFLSHQWLHSWWVSYRPSARLSLLVAERGSEIIGIAPMMIGTEQRWGIKARVLRFVGDGTAETDHMTILSDGRFYEAALAALLEAIDGLKWDVAYFNQVPNTSRSASLIQLCADRRGWKVEQERVACPVSVLPSTVDVLLSGMPARFRSALRSTRRKVSDAYRVEFGEVEDRSELEPALVALFSNHASRWSAKGSQGVFADERKRTFYRRLSTRLLERGWLRFYWLKLDGQIVSQQYCFQYGDTVMLLQEGFDFDFAKINVGNLLRLLVFENLIQQRVGSYDFLAGESRHKSNWSNETRYDLKIECARRNLRGRAFTGVPRVVARGKHFLRSFIARRPQPETE